MKLILHISRVLPLMAVNMFWSHDLKKKKKLIHRSVHPYILSKMNYPGFHELLLCKKQTNYRHRDKSLGTHASPILRENPFLAIYSKSVRDIPLDPISLARFQSPVSQPGRWAAQLCPSFPGGWRGTSRLVFCRWCHLRAKTSDGHIWSPAVCFHISWTDLTHKQKMTLNDAMVHVQLHLSLYYCLGKTHQLSPAQTA